MLKKLGLVLTVFLIFSCKAEIQTYKEGNNQTDSTGPASQPDSDDQVLNVDEESLLNTVDPAKLNIGTAVSSESTLPKTPEVSNPGGFLETTDNNYPSELPENFTGPVYFVPYATPAEFSWSFDPEATSAIFSIIPQYEGGSPTAPLDVTNRPNTFELIETQNLEPGYYQAKLTVTRPSQVAHYYQPFVVVPVVTLTGENNPAIVGTRHNLEFAVAGGADELVFEENDQPFTLDQDAVSYPVASNTAVQVSVVPTTINPLVYAVIATKNGVQSNKAQYSPPNLLAEPSVLKTGIVGIGSEVIEPNVNYISADDPVNYPPVLPGVYTGPVAVVDVGQEMPVHWSLPDNASSQELVVYPFPPASPRTPLDMSSLQAGTVRVDTTNYAPGYYVAELNYIREDGGKTTNFWPFVVRPRIIISVRTPEILQVEVGKYTLTSPDGADSAVIKIADSSIPSLSNLGKDVNTDLSFNPTTVGNVAITGYIIKNNVRSTMASASLKVVECVANSFACKYAQVQKRCDAVAKEDWLGTTTPREDFITRVNISNSCEYSATAARDANGNFGRVATGYSVITARWPLDYNAAHTGCTEPTNLPDPAKYYVCDFEVMSYDKLEADDAKAKSHKIRVHDQGGMTLGVSGVGKAHYVFSHMVKGMVDKLDRAPGSDLPIYDWNKIVYNPSTETYEPYNIGNVNSPTKFNGGQAEAIGPASVDKMPSRNSPSVWQYEAHEKYAQKLFSQLYVDGVTPINFRMGVHTYGDGNESDVKGRKDCAISGLTPGQVEGEAKFRIKYWYVPVAD